MIELAVTLISLSVGGLILILYYSYNGTYKKFQKVLVPQHFADTPEVQDTITLTVEKGRIPTWLTGGVMYRIGPGRFNIKENDGSIYVIRHAFDGLPFLHRFEVNGQTQILKYNSRLLAKGLESKIKNKTFKGGLFFGHMPQLTFYEWLVDFYSRLANLVLFPKPVDESAPDEQAVGVTATPNFPLPPNMAKNDNEKVLVSKTDANILQKIHAETLEPQHIFSYTSFDKRVQGHLSAAHHQFDPITKEIFNFSLTISPQPRMVVFSMTKDGRTTILADFTHRFDKSPLQSSYIHSFWLTNNYIIIPETPLTFQDKGKNMMLNGSVLSSLSWNSKSPTWCHVIRRHIDRPGQDGLVASIPVPSFFTFHAGNAFESICASTGNTMLTLDCASFVNGDVMHQLYRFGLPHRKGPSVTRAKQTTFLNGIATPPARQTEFGDYIRYKLNLDQSKVVSIDTLANNVEFPRFNQAYAMKATNQFVYGCQLYGFTEKMDETGGLVKMNLKNKDLKTYGEEGSVCSEPIFVPRPGAEKEDDGVLLSLVNDSNCCYFIVIDALDMKELARVRIGYFTAVTFHGSYVDHEFESINVN